MFYPVSRAILQAFAARLVGSSTVGLPVGRTPIETCVVDKYNEQRAAVIRLHSIGSLRERLDY
jgi:hypothetical protein